MVRFSASCMRWGALVALGGLGAAAAPAQTTVYVNGLCGDDTWSGVSAACLAPDGPKRTIQAGIDATLSGDTVIVADGVYSGTGNRDLDFGGRDITVRSASGDPADCTIDCELAGRGFWFHSGETAAARVSGFTLRSGRAAQGSAILCELGSSPTIANCLLTGNDATMINDSAGALACLGSGATVTACVFRSNAASAGHGAAVVCVASDMTFTGCRFEENTGLYSGALDAYIQSHLTLTDCVFIRNRSDYCCGAGVVYDDCTVLFTRCAFLGNLALGPTSGGGGFVVQLNSQADVRDCRFVGNFTPSGGGALWCGDNSDIAISNATFRANVASSVGALRIVRNADGIAELRNCILFGNSPNEIVIGTGSVSVAHSNVSAGWPGPGNIIVNPSFGHEPAAGADSVWGTPDDDYGDLRLLAGSLCIDAGDAAFVPAPGESDLDGRLRVWDGNADGAARVDMGAYEFGAPTAGDLNCDGSIDFFDIDPFLLAQFEPAAYAAAYPNCARATADLNGDGSVDFFDIDPFVAALFGA